MRSLAPLVALFLVVPMVVGCENDDKRSRGGPFTIVTDMDFRTEPIHGTFRVRPGSEKLGCSRGTFVDHPLVSGAILKVLTCTDGERGGSFLIRFELAFERWKFRSGTGDFTGVEGNGHYANRRRPELSGVETLKGTVDFASR